MSKVETFNDIHAWDNQSRCERQSSFLLASISMLRVQYPRMHFHTATAPPASPRIANLVFTSPFDIATRKRFFSPFPNRNRRCPAEYHCHAGATELLLVPAAMACVAACSRLGFEDSKVLGDVYLQE